MAIDKDRTQAIEPGTAVGGADGPDRDATASAGSSGSIDVQVSVPGLPAASESAQSSRSIEVQLGDADPAGAEPDRVAAVAGELADTRSKRIAGVAKEALGEGVSLLGEGVTLLGEGVSRLGDMSRIPVVGSGVAKLGEGITQVGESLHSLPKVARTRRGRLLIRSMVVGFVLVAAWIIVIVALQLHGNNTPDFRPNAEHILVNLSKGAIDDVYEQASPRFQEMVRKERFTDDMTDLEQTVGKFREITAVNDTLVTTGATGRIGRVSLTVAYQKASCKVSVSLHLDQGRWKLLGIGIELPPELKITQAQREERVKACKDPMDIKHCDVHKAADAILQLRDGHADQVWDGATAVFQKLEHKEKFVQLQLEHQLALGSYRRIIAVTEAKVIGSPSASGGMTATFDTLAEFEKASGVRTVFAFYRRSRLDPWKLRSFKIALPMPRAAEDTTATAEAPTPPPPSLLPALRASPPSPSPRPAPSPSPSRPAPSPAPSPAAPSPAAPSPAAPAPSHLAPRDAGAK